MGVCVHGRGEGLIRISLSLQMYLQRLNYLSLTYKIDGVYTDTTLQAVRRFQVCIISPSLNFLPRVIAWFSDPSLGPSTIPISL